MVSFGDGPPEIKPNNLPLLLRVDVTRYPFRLSMAQLLGKEPTPEYTDPDFYESINA